MHNNEYTAIIKLLLPDVNDMEMIQKYGPLAWAFVFVVKIIGAFAIGWFIVKILGLEVSLGNKRH